MLRDRLTRTDAQVSVTVQTASSDVSGTSIDLQGFGAATVLFEIGAGGITFTSTNKLDVVLKHGDASDGSDAAAVAAADIILTSGYTWATGGIVKSIQTAHASGEVIRVGYLGAKRYLTPVFDFSGTHATGTPISAVVLRQNPDLAPV